jgi:ATP-binding cassette subfamily F protein 1
MYGKNGKKLSNKERKRLIKEREAAERAAEYEKVAAKNSAEGAQFACSQTAVNEKDPQWQNSLDINVPNFSISAAGKILFKDAALNIAHGRRYGLVGANGRGKSTLLKMIASYDLLLPPRIDFLYVEQEVVADNTPAVEAVLRADKVRWNLVEEEKNLMTKVDAGDESDEVIDRLGIVVEELANMGADSMEAKAHGILSGLGFTTEMQTKPTKMFSGGWRMRISLARALFVEPTLLMLDEPTNHLDLNAVIWLDDYLQSWKKTLFVVSHDQDFLNSVCQEILHIEDLKLIAYKGNYDSFKKAEADRLKQTLKAYEKQEKRIRELKRQGQSKNKAQETMKKSSKREAGARSQKKQNQAIAIGTEAAEVQELIKRPKEYTVKLEFTDVPELSRPVMEVTNVNFRYSEKHPVIFDKIDFGIDMDSRICVVGPNGSGKTVSRSEPWSLVYWLMQQPKEASICTGCASLNNNPSHNFPVFRCICICIFFVISLILPDSPETLDRRDQCQQRRCPPKPSLEDGYLQPAFRRPIAHGQDAHRALARPLQRSGLPELPQPARSLRAGGPCPRSRHERPERWSKGPCGVGRVEFADAAHSVAGRTDEQPRHRNH